MNPSEDEEQESLMSRVLQGLDDAESRAELARWAAENRVHETDPLWIYIAIQLFFENRYKVHLAKLDQATDKSAQIIQDQIRQGEIHFVNVVWDTCSAGLDKVYASASEGIEGITETTDESTRRITQLSESAQRSLHAMFRRAFEDHRAAMEQLVTDASEEIRHSVHSATRAPVRHRWRRRLAPIGVGASAAAIFGWALFGGFSSPLAPPTLTEADANAIHIGRRVQKSWAYLDEAQREQFRDLLDTKDAPSEGGA
jgi:hypothetical protein